jgi:hypothetical protein
MSSTRIPAAPPTPTLVDKIRTALQRSGTKTSEVLGTVENSSYQSAILWGLQRKPNVYQQTVDPVTVQERRQANRVGRRSRRINRLRRKH